MSDPVPGVRRVHYPWAGARRPLGRHLTHDPRSRQYRADVAGVVLRRKVHRHFGAVLDQGALGSCTGNSATQALNCRPLLRAGDRPRDEAFAVDLYSAATRLDEWAGAYPPDDTGSSGIAAAKALRAAGLIDRYEWGFGLDDTLRLATTDVLSVGSEWTEGMFDPDGAGFIHPTGPVAGGHQWTIRGIDPRQEWVLIINSWGAGWGGWTDPRTGRRIFPGHARLSFADLAGLLGRGGDVVRFVRDTPVGSP